MDRLKHMEVINKLKEIHEDEKDPRKKKILGRKKQFKKKMKLAVFKKSIGYGCESWTLID